MGQAGIEKMGFFGFLKIEKKYEKILFDGAPGDSEKSAVIIRGAPSHIAGVLAEYAYLAEKFGECDVDWMWVGQTLRVLDNRSYGLMEIGLSDGAQKTITFDITDFSGKGQRSTSSSITHSMPRMLSGVLKPQK
jgi:hypothetical protein